jgi:hypothetical protein
VPDAQAFFNEAEAYRAQGDYAGAAGWYQMALDEYAGYCDAAYNLARIHTDVYPDPQRVSRGARFGLGSGMKGRSPVPLDVRGALL